MAGTVSTKIELDGGKSFAQALKDIANAAKLADSEMRKTASAVDQDASSLKKATAQHEILSKRIEEQTAIVARLKAVMDDSIEQNGENAKETLKAREAYNNAVASLNQMESQLDDTTDEMKKYGKETSAATTISNAAKTAFVAVGKGVAEAAAIIAKGAAAVAGAATAMATAAGVALVGLTKEAVNAYGELEQAYGGAESVFQEFNGVVIAESREAYKTMGITQTEFLATANKMGALFQGSGIDIERSAELSTKAMQRATDMASVMGIDVSDALNAVTGAAKGNYTMMDNLGVAMNATTLEAYAVSKGMDKAFSEMDNAEKAELAMQYFFENTAQYAGNFEKEATQTISGSFGLLKASAQSLIAEFGDFEGDAAGGMTRLVDAFMTVVQNVKPAVEAVISQLPMVLEAIGVAIQEVAPSLIAIAQQVLEALLSSLLTMLPMILPVIQSAFELIGAAVMENLPQIIQVGMDIIGNLASGLIEALPLIAESAIELIMMLVNKLMEADTVTNLVTAAMNIVSTLANALIENLPTLLVALESMLGDFMNGLADAIPDLIDMAMRFVMALLTGLTNPDSLSKMIRGALRLIVELAKGLVSAIPQLTEALPEIIASVLSTLIELAPEMITAAVELISQLVVGLIGAIPLIIKMIPDIINKMKEKFADFDWASLGKNIMEGIKNGIINMANNLVKTIADTAKKLLDSAKKALGIGSPSKEFAKVGKYMGEGLDIGITKSFKQASKDMERELSEMPVQASATLSAASAGGQSRAFNFGAVSFNVYAHEGQDARTLAREVERIFMSDLRTKEGAFA